MITGDFQCLPPSNENKLSDGSGQSQAAGCESTLVNIDIRRMTQWSRWLERLVWRRGRQRAGARGADTSDAAVLGRDCFEHVLCKPYALAPAGAN
jgi:hypothetical protein